MSVPRVVVYVQVSMLDDLCCCLRSFIFVAKNWNRILKGAMDA